MFVAVWIAGLATTLYNATLNIDGDYQGFHCSITLDVTCAVKEEHSHCWRWPSFPYWKVELLPAWCVPLLQI